MRAVGFAVVSSLVLLTGCGYVGPVMPPSPLIPTQVQDLVAVQRGDKIEVTFHTPGRAADGVAIKQFSQIDLRIGPTLVPFDFESWAVTAKAFPLNPPPPNDPFDPKPQPMSTSVPIEGFAGKHVAVAVRTAVKKGDNFSAWSNRILLDIVEPLAQPTDVKVAASADGVVIDWTAVERAHAYRILRQAPGEEKLSEVGTSDSNHFIDKTSQFDVPYQYAVVALAEGGAESPRSKVLSITPVDIFPPAVPSAVAALAGPESIELSWQRSPESDLAGYIIYRSVDNGPWERLPGMVNLPSFSDRTVEHGKTYRYEITSIDKKNNESAKSEAVSVAF